MKIIETKVKDLVVLEPRVFEDERGYFFESFNNSKMPEEIATMNWVQDNESKSTRGVLRGLHYQSGDYAQAKLVRAITGRIYDVAVDIRPGSPTYGLYHGEILSEENKRQMFIPRGFAHGFVVLSDTAIFSYKCDNYYKKDAEGGISYSDTTLDIPWPIDLADVILSEKDGQLPSFGNHREA